MKCPYCGAMLAVGARFCQACGRLMAPGGPPPGASPPTPQYVPTPTEPPPSPYGPASTQPAPQGPPPPYQPPGSPYGSDDPYGPFFDPAWLSLETAHAWRQHRFHATFSVLLSIVVHILTSGLAAPFLMTRKFTFLPKVPRDDFSTGKATGYLFIPFYNLYWIFVICRRIADRLRLQTRLWGVPGSPSRGLGTTIAIFTCVGVIPYLGVLFTLVGFLALWPVYLGQIQATCNRLALAAAPAEFRPMMLQLERWTRLRWLGWIVMGPTLVFVIGSVLTLFGIGTAPPESMAGAVAGLIIFALIAAGGGAMWYLGSRGTRALYHEMSMRVPHIVAGYLRIDKNAAWTMAWLTIPWGVLFVLVGIGALIAPSPSTPEGQGMSILIIGITFLGFAAYAVARALQLKSLIAWLDSVTPAPPMAGPDASPAGADVPPRW